VDYVPTVVATHLAYPSLGVKTVCDRVAEAALEAGLIKAPYLNTFANSLRTSYRRYLQNPNKDARHGNLKLTEDEEDFLLGFLEGYKRHGQALGQAEIIEIAEILFPEYSFGESWYENFTERYKEVLKFGRTKSTSTSRTSTATLDSTKQFQEHLRAHLKSTPFSH